MMEKIDMKEAVKEYIENFAATMELIPFQAKAKKAHFDELIDSGFTEAQALEIVKGILG